MKIRRLGPGDLALASAVINRFKSVLDASEHADQFLRNESNYLIAAMDGDEPVGFILAYALRRTDGPSAKLLIYEIEVGPEHRRRGIGTELIRHALEWVEKKEMISAFVLTNHSNQAAVEFFKSTGAIIPNGDDLMFVYAGGKGR